jgi:hypothetical protein
MLLQLWPHQQQFALLSRCAWRRASHAGNTSHSAALAAAAAELLFTCPVIAPVNPAAVPQPPAAFRLSCRVAPVHLREQAAYQLSDHLC